LTAAGLIQHTSGGGGGAGGGGKGGSRSADMMKTFLKRCDQQIKDLEKKMLDDKTLSDLQKKECLDSWKRWKDSEEQVRMLLEELEKFPPPK
jgi:hypothetical protein